MVLCYIGAKNTDENEFTAEGDYKFFYDMANITYFASVKFPKHVRLTRDQKQELAYILLKSAVQSDVVLVHMQVVKKAIHMRRDLTNSISHKILM